MMRVFGCITQDHDIRLVALAACICALGCFTTTTLITRSKIASSDDALNWLLVAATVFGCSIWSLHFVAMLAFMPGMAISYDLSLTVVSIVIAITGSLLALMAWRLIPLRWLGAVLSGSMLGLTIAGMHYTGVSAMRLPAELTFDHRMVAASLVLCVVCATIAMARADALTLMGRRVEVSAWLALSICGVHFTGMAAVQLELGLELDTGQSLLGSDSLAIAVGSVSLAVLALSLAATLMEKHLSQRTAEELSRMRLLSDFAQDSIIIHRKGKVLEINSAGTRLFDRPAEAIIGKPVLSLFAEKNTGALMRRLQDTPDELLPEEVEIETQDGKPIPLEVSSRTIEFKGKPATVVALRDLSDRKKNEERIRHLAHHDALTDLPNRFMLQERLSRALELAAQNATKVALFYLDLDRFKPVNDVIGHAGGDALLVQVSNRLLGEIRSDDTLARVGGDEFIIVQTNYQTIEDVSALVSRLIDRLNQPFEILGHSVDIGVSIGIALYPSDGTTPEVLLRAADMAMYRVKEEKRGAWRFFDPSMDAELHERHLLEQDLRHAVARNELVLFYQPLVDCKTAEVTAYEALMRWQHPERGLLSPGVFIPIAEEIGIINQLGQWAIETACRTATTWPKPWRVAVNVSPIQFRQSSLSAIVARALAATGLDPARLEIEITEGVFIEDAVRAVGVLSSLRDLGVRMSLDDFGTGYSSLSYLRLFPFDKIKVDQSFVREMGHSVEVETIVKAIVNLGHNLGLSVTVEGVETFEQLAFLKSLGSDHLQGYLLGRPAPNVGIAPQDSSRVNAMLVGPAVALAG